MIPWLIGITTLLAAPPDYSEVQINNLIVSSVNPLLGKAAVNARQVDLNQDEYVDLVFTDRVLLQRNGTYDETDAIPLPRTSDGPAIDFYNNTLFLRFPDALQSYALVNGEWQVRLDMPMEWDHEGPRRTTEDTDEESEPAPPRQPSFEQYVYDIDNDGFPELLFPLQDGLHLYRLDEGQFVHTQPLDIFPATRLIPLDSLNEATGISRSITFPDQYVRFHCVIDAPQITIVTQHRDTDTFIHFESTSHTIRRDEDAYIAETTGPATVSASIHDGMQPVRISNDEIAYVGAFLDYASTLAILTPVFTTRIQFGDQDLTVFRAKSFTPHTIFTDANHDGIVDLVQETTHIADGGLRETLMRFTTQKSFRHTVAVHLGTGGGHFESDAAYAKTFSMRLDQTPIRLSTMFQRYQAGKLVNLTGDFNRDGQNDLVVQTRPDELALFLHNGHELDAKPALVLPIEDYETFHVLDLNGDNVSDILFQGTPIDDIQTRNPTRALLFRARRTQP